MARGGAREGAGRPARDWVKRVEVRLNAEELELLERYANAYEVEGTRGPRPLTLAEAFRQILTQEVAKALQEGDLAPLWTEEEAQALLRLRAALSEANEALEDLPPGDPLP